MKYLEWLVNVVVVPKKCGKWRVCVDYIDLNEACLKDSFPLSHIDHIVDVVVGHETLSFFDAFSRYHQIPMHPPEAKKNDLHYIAWVILLQCDAFWLEECRGDLLKVSN